MSHISILDCTLRDGGYCNNWRFGYENIKKIISGLCESGVELIECGFLSNRAASYDSATTLFTDTIQLIPLLPQNSTRQKFVCMLNYGDYDVKNLPLCKDSLLDGIRVAFHKPDMLSALKLCYDIKEKGYKVYVQAMVSLNYNDNEFLELIKQVNEIEPYCFYIVDSFGAMKKRELLRLFYLVDNNLKENIKIGFHSHNNLQLAYSNAQILADMQTHRNLIIDCCVFGMGRGAGNLNTELFLEYLNDSKDSHYLIKPLLIMIDDILNSFYQRNYWGYSLPNYLSAKYNSHPNYASYLDNKKTLTIEAMDDIFSVMDDSRRSSFDVEYVESLYTEYMENGSAQEVHLAELSRLIKNHVILIIAPGRSSVEEKNKILPILENKNIISVSINHAYTCAKTDMIFVSNLKRFREIDKSFHSRCIITSNIPATDIYLKIAYGELLNDIDGVHDNAGMMLIQFMINLGASKLLICGMDGYSADPLLNYSNEEMNLYTQRAVLDQMNVGMGRMIKRFKRKIDIQFVTEPKYINFSEERL